MKGRNMERKPLSAIAWDIPEPEYRKDPALSYSTLQKYERNGRFSSLETLFDQVSSPQLTFGSVVDTLMTGTQEDFENSFVVLDDPGLSDNLKEITETLFSRYKEVYGRLEDIPDEIVAQVGKECNYYAGDKYEATRVKKIRESCNGWYSMLTLAEGKKVITQEDILDARRCIDALKTSPATARYFAENDPFNKDIEGYYQLKFKGEDPQTGIQYRCMADRIIVNHKDKVILPIDLKTSSHTEWEFYKSFTQWRYDLQARTYWRLIRQNMDKDDYYREFKLLDYRFITVNRNTLTPLVWEFKLTQAVGQLDIPTPSGYVYHLRDPFVIGKELKAYLDNPRKIPFEIEETKPNDIVTFIKYI